MNPLRGSEKPDFGRQLQVARLCEVELGPFSVNTAKWYLTTWTVRFGIIADTRNTWTENGFPNWFCQKLAENLDNQTW